MPENASANGVFGMKMHFNQFGDVFSEKPSGFQRGLEFPGNFQKYILIYLHDKFLRAISNAQPHLEDIEPERGNAESVIPDILVNLKEPGTPAN